MSDLKLLHLENLLELKLFNIISQIEKTVSIVDVVCLILQKGKTPFENRFGD